MLAKIRTIRAVVFALIIFIAVISLIDNDNYGRSIALIVAGSIGFVATIVEIVASREKTSNIQEIEQLSIHHEQRPDF